MTNLAMRPPRARVRGLRPVDYDLLRRRSHLKVGNAKASTEPKTPLDRTIERVVRPSPRRRVTRLSDNASPLCKRVRGQASVVFRSRRRLENGSDGTQSDPRLRERRLARRQPLEREPGREEKP